MEIRAVIVDDEERHHSVLDKMLKNFCPGILVEGNAFSIREAVPIIEEKQPHLVFLDIEMPGGNGFTIFDHFEEPPFQVIFTTAFDLYAINAIKYAALDYLLKPINIQELKNAVARAEKVLEKQSKENIEKIQALKSNIQLEDRSLTKIALRSSDGIDFVEAKDVIRVEANQVYSNFYLQNGKKILVSKPLGEFESMLESCNFFRVHKSHMVNLDHIVKYVKGKGGYVIMKDGSNVDVSVRKKEKFLKRLV
ncbi:MULTISPECIES: LytR/AlgR family response regulator transcription factor [Flagellimonas]|uniref:LytTR family DNA-binding domain-containing protein n=1 Tax=Flagellimonas spongiicola TaxID=2942208 RepID=A0ABT0PSI2_9FLAO|nr:MULTISPECIES: LytTR family DNA-binding domain-containing protein [Allomuricauda]MCL6267757.1 LytTR family DNA-binding domain-containing protein [Muricauda myxillae]MCL6273697.1 LytTR family DNA-binding domain-containing protein [Allomuricauda spongiicola]